MMHMEHITPLTPILFNYSDAYILVKETIIVTRRQATVYAASKQQEKRNKGVTFKNFSTFTDYISKANNTQVDNAKDIDVRMLI